MKAFKNFLKSDYGFLLILAIIIFTVYGKTINYGFTKYDDHKLIAEHINFISDFKNIPKLFTTSCYYDAPSQCYRPILSLSFSIESVLFKFNTKVYHLSNIILFIISIYSIYIFLLKLKQNSVILKFICLLAAVHPVFSSCIAWIPARNDTLLVIFTCFSFINLIDYLNYNKNSHMLLFFLFFSLGLFTKETSLIFPAIYIVYLYIFKINITKTQIIKLSSGLLLIFLVYFYLRTVSVLPYTINPHAFRTYIFKVLNGTIIYLSKFLIPDYIPVMLYNINLSLPDLILSIMLLIFLLFILHKKFITAKNTLFGFIWLFFCLSPTFLMNDSALLFHRFLISVIGLMLILSEFTNNINLKYPVLKKYFNVIFIILFCTYSYASYIQSEKYKNSSVFWTTAYYDAPDYHIACGCLGIEYLQAGNLEKAGEFLLLANKYSPGIYLLDIGILMIHKQKFDEAEKLLLKSAEIVPATKYLAYGNLSELYIKKNNLKKGLEYAQMAYNLNNKYINSSQLLIKAYILNNEFEKALTICFDMLKYDRNNPQYYYTIGVLYETLKDYKNALKYIEEGLKLAPENIRFIEKIEYLKNLQK